MKLTPILLVLAMVPATATAQVNKKVLREAETKLRGPGEATVRDGALLCLDQNNVPAVELLLDVLSADQPHRRDIVWEVLPKITDPYARKRVEKELRSNRDGRVRQWSAQALGLFGDREFGRALEKALGDKEPFVRAAAAQALGRLKHPPATARLKGLLPDRDPSVRAYAAEAIATINPSEWRKDFGESMTDPDAGVRAFLLGTVPTIYPTEVEALADTALGDEDWRVRMTAVEILAKQETKTAVDILLRALGDGRPAVVNKAIEYMQRIAGLKYTMRVQWDEWWRVNREEFAFPEGDANLKKNIVEGTSQVRFNGLQVSSDHVAFVIDKSSDMNRAAANGKVKDEIALQELTDTLALLHGGDFVFNIHTYGSDFNTFEDEPVVLDKKTEKKALEFVSGIRRSGSKAIWEVLDRVVANPTIDTIYLLSSGEPEIGLYVHYNRVCDHLNELNRFHKVKIHTVAYTDSKWYQDQLQKIAETTGGEFVAKP